jgi:hypothetical protein
MAARRAAGSATVDPDPANTAANSVYVAVGAGLTFVHVWINVTHVLWDTPGEVSESVSKTKAQVELKSGRV